MLTADKHHRKYTCYNGQQFQPSKAPNYGKLASR